MPLQTAVRVITLTLFCAQCIATGSPRRVSRHHYLWKGVLAAPQHDPRGHTTARLLQQQSMQDSAGVTPSYGPASAHSDLTSAYVPAPGPGVVPAPAPDAQHAASPAITEVGDHLVPPPSLALEPQPPSPVDGTVVAHTAPVIAPAAAPELSSASTPLLTPQNTSASSPAVAQPPLSTIASAAQPIIPPLVTPGPSLTPEATVSAATALSTVKMLPPTASRPVAHTGSAPAPTPAIAQPLAPSADASLVAAVLPPTPGPAAFTANPLVAAPAPQPSASAQDGPGAPVPLSEPALPPNAAVSAPLATPTLGPAPSAEAPGAARVGGLAPVGQPASAPKQVASAPGPLPMITPAPGPAAATGNASGGPVAAQRSPSSRPLSTCQTACQAGIGAAFAAVACAAAAGSLYALGLRRKWNLRQENMRIKSANLYGPSKPDAPLHTLPNTAGKDDHSQELSASMGQAHLWWQALRHQQQILYCIPGQPANYGTVVHWPEEGSLCTVRGGEGERQIAKICVAPIFQRGQPVVYVGDGRPMHGTIDDTGTNMWPPNYVIEFPDGTLHSTTEANDVMPVCQR